MVNSGGETSERAEVGGLGRVSFLEQTLWKQFNEATSVEDFARAWLGLQCSLIAEVTSGVVVLGDHEEGAYAPVAHWPVAGVGSPGLNAAAELALSERHGVVQEHADSGQAAATSSFVAYPIIVDDHLFGVAALEIEAGRRLQLRNVMRQLQWGIGWIEVILRREHARHEKARTHRMGAAFDLLAAALEQQGFQDACNATVTELAMRLDCDQVSVGFLRGKRVAIAAVSHAAQFGRRMNLVRDIAAAMEEAIDQEAIVLYPKPDDWEFRIDRAHRELARANADGAILTVPLHVGGSFFGALTFERPVGAGFDEDLVALCDCVAGTLGPILEEKRQNDRLVVIKLAESLWTQIKRLLGPRYFGRKLATALVLAVVLFFSFAKKEYAVTAPAVLEGAVQRAMVSPFDGYVASQHVRAGDVVRGGEVMAVLDDKDLVIERLKWSTKKGEQEREYSKALAKQERADVSIIQAQIQQAVAQIALLDEEIKRTRITAPFDALVISGDLSQSVGAAVKRGDELFQIAPLDSYRVILKIDERDITDIRPEQTGTLLVTSIPLEPLHYVVKRVTPIAEAEEGANSFRVEAILQESPDRIRPGMKGVSKTEVEERLLIRIWTRRLTDWLRIMIWKWLP